jgi:hypothetical protein
MTKIRFEMQSWNAGTDKYDPPDDLIVCETVDTGVESALDLFNDFLRAIYGVGWEVDFKEVGPDEFVDD